MKKVKQLTGILAISAIGAMAFSTAQAADDVSLRLNWLLGGVHTPFFLGLELGYYEDEDISLTINEGTGSGVAMQVIAAKGDTFGMSDAGTLMLGVSQGQPVQAVMSLVNTTAFGVISLADMNIKTAEDLEGKTFASSAGDALTQLFPAIIAANNLDADKISLVFMDPGAKTVAVMEGRVDALLGGIDDQVFAIRAQGFEATALGFGDLGVNTVGLTVHAHEDTIKDAPDLVARFVRASQRSWQAAIDDPQAAVDAALRVKPDQDPTTLYNQLTASLPLMNSPNTEGRPIGYGAEADWEKTLDLLTKYRELQTDRPASSFHTNEFVE